SARNPLSLIDGAAAHPAEPSPAPPSRPTSVSFSGALTSRPLKDRPAFSFSTPSSDPLRPSRFLIGVSDRGEVRYAFLQESSGDPAFDALAATQLQELSFAKNESPIAWG